MAKKHITKDLTTDAQVQRFKLLSPMLNAVYGEIKELSKKKQDEVLNKLKVEMLNKILEQIKELLSGEPTTQFLELLDNDILPTNSDAVLVLVKFQTAMEHFHTKYFRSDKYSHRWFTTENP
ncbi:MAG: hypothetical protein KAW47_01980 [Thermoplasmatales archaeon]|nr:hypothetical protein [Thermoplasmatales archaeon]